MLKVKRAFVDTNVLLTSSKQIFGKYQHIVISDIVLEEIDKIKHFGSEDAKYKARLATREILEHEDKVEYVITENSQYLPGAFDMSRNDNKILNAAEKMKRFYGFDSIVVLSNDLNMIQKCKLLELSTEEVGEENFLENGYKGYKKLNLNADEIYELYADLKSGNNKYNLIENQYVIINEGDKISSCELRYSNGELLSLKLPNSKVIKGMNSQQRCALDLLNNKDIPIKIIAGSFGSGKTLLATKMGMHHIFDKGNYGKMLLIRNPLGSGEEIGFLKGEKEAKIDPFFRCVEQYINFANYSDKGSEYIEKDIPYYIKGLSYGSTYVLVDEAEDMDLRILKLIGSRIEQDSTVVFCGDYQQTEPKYKRDNGLYQLIEKSKGDSRVGIVVFDECVRSDASKFFADL